MKPAPVVVFVLAWCAAQAQGLDDFIDRVDGALTFSSSDGHARARISGTLDLEAYAFPQPAPAFIDSTGHGLVSPRLSTFLDAQLGSSLYVFAQARVDRGFDPTDEEPLEARLDEYALRLTPWANERLNVQIGKFATVVGNWVPRHASWDNPFVNAPLPYENLTGVWDAIAAPSLGTLLGWAHVRPEPPRPVPSEDKYVRLPVIWGPSYANGVAVSGQWAHLTYAFEVKSASLSSRPSQWTSSVLEARHPTLSGRLGFHPSAMWNFGVSVSRGIYLRPEAAATIRPGAGLGDYRQTVIGQDLSFAWHHFQLWAELYEARFAIPRIGNADTFSYYVEARYKLTPQWFGSIRWNEQLFGHIPDPKGGTVRWGADLWRVDLATGYRFTPNLQLKLQYSLQHEQPAAKEMAHLFATQLVLRF